MRKTDTQEIHFVSEVHKIGAWLIVRIPEKFSRLLPSRGLVHAAVTFNGHTFKMLLEPDGRGSHWFRIDNHPETDVDIQAGSNIEFRLKTVNGWPEPEVPDDLQHKLSGNPEALKTWRAATPLARWDWIRWLNSAAGEETRKRRLAIADEKLSRGENHVCCFNRSICSVKEVSKRGILLLN